MLKHMQRKTKVSISMALVAAFGGTLVQADPAEAARATIVIRQSDQPTERQTMEFDLKLHGDVTQTDPQVIDVPNACHDGGLRVTAEVSENYVGREHRPAQKEETVVVQMWRDGDLVAELGPTPDLPDGIRSAFIQTDLGTLPVPVEGDELIVRLANVSSSDTNSVNVDSVTLTPECNPPVKTIETERIVQVERSATGNQTLATCEAGILGVVARMYESYFDRQPDRTGLLFWSGQLGAGMRLEQVSGFFQGSEEFAAMHGELSDEDFVHTIYRNALDRSAEPGGLAFWVDQMSLGRTRGWVVTMIAVQPESLRAGCYAR